MKRKILQTTIIALIFIFKSSAQTNIPAGDVEGIWNKANSPYIIEGNINVVNTLRIDPGTEIQFKDGVKMNVTGKLLAVGTRSDSIKFLNYNDKWNGIKFINNSANSEMKYFKLFGVRNLEFPEGALVIKNSNNLKVSHAEIFNNSSEYGGAGINLLELNNFDLSHILLYNNSLYSDGGGFTSRRGSAIMLNHSQVNFYNITSVKNGFNQLVNQQSSTIFIDTASEAKFTNCIIYSNNGPAIRFYNGDDIAYITNSNIENLSYYETRIIGENNFDELPNFVSKDKNNYSLKWDNYPDENNKPKEIDGGVDFIHDSDGSISDIGAISYDQTGSYFPPSVWFDVDKNKIQLGSKVNFINNCLKGSNDIVSYLWDFGDGVMSNEENPSHIYNKLGRFKVKLKITDNTGTEIEKGVKDFIISGTIINEGPVEGVWEKSKSPYIIKGNLTVSSSKMLEIHEGVEIIFDGYFGIKVYGDLKTMGKNNSRITFTSLDRDFFWDRRNHYNYYTYKYFRSGWQGIVFSGNNNNSELRYSDFSFVRNKRMFNVFQEFGVAVWVFNNNNFLIDNCNFKNNHAASYGLWDNNNIGAAIRSKDSNLTITNCLFEDNIADAKIVISLANTNLSLIKNNIFKNNRVVCPSDSVVCSADAIIYVTMPTWNDDDKVVFEDNLIQNNSGGVAIGGLTRNPPEVIIKNNVFKENKNVSISAGGGKGALIINNLIINNESSFYPGGIRSFGYVTIINNYIKGNIVRNWNASASAILVENALETKIINNTIVDNFNSKRLLTHAVFADNTSLTAINNIVYNNGNGSIGQNNGGGTYPPNVLSNNYFENPYLIEENSPKLSSMSGCIDAGTRNLPINLPEFDFYSNPRVYGFNIDIGAVEYNNTLSIENNTENNNILKIINPVKDELVIIFKNNKSERIKSLKVFDLNSKLLKEYSNIKYKMDFSFLKTGVYLLEVELNNNSKVHKIIKL